jgi:sugar lactone lactonase YvrE
MALGLLAAGMAVSAQAQTLRRVLHAAAGRCVVVLLPVLLAVGMPVSAQAQSMLTLTSSGTSQVFPIAAVGQSNSQSFTLTASGVDQVDLWSVQIAPGYSATYEYQITSSTCTAYLFMAPGASCSFTVYFYPKLPGSASSPVPIGRTAPLQVTYQYADPIAGWIYQVVNYPLIGSGTTPTAVMTPGLISDLVGSDISPKTGYAGDGGVASGAVFNNPAAIAVDGLGNIYIADTGNNVVRVVYKAGGIPNVASPVAGKIYTVAGIAPTGSASTAGAGVDGVAATASPLNGPSGIALDAAGNLYIADTGNSAVRMVSATTGIINTVAGTLNNGGVATSSGCCFSGDQGAATLAQLYNPAGIAVDGNGNIYIADSGNNAIRVVYMGGTPLAGLIATEYTSAATATAGDIYTIAGGLGNLPATGNGDGGLASAANLNLPLAVTVDSAGDLYFADSQNQSVRRVDAVTGNIGTLYQAATSPPGLSVDASDDIYFTLQGSCTVLQYNPTTQYGMTTPAMLPVAGNGSCTASGDGGAATEAGLNGAPGLVVDGTGNLYLLEADGVRFVDGSQTSFAFGSVNVGNTSPAQTAIVTDEDIIVPSNPAMSGLQGNYSGYFTVTPPFATTPYTNPNANPFNPNLNSNDCSNNQSYFALSPGDTCGTSFVFQPIADSTGGLPFTQTDYSNSASNHVQLSGTGAGPLPTATLTGGPLNFTGVVQMGYGAAQTLTLANTSNVNLTISSINPNQYNVPPFKETDNCGTLLAAHSTCTLSVTYSATATGLQTMTLTVTDNASSGGGTQTATLNGTGTAPVANLSVSSIQFPLTAPGASSAASIVTVTNTGTAPLTFCSTAIVAPSPSPQCFGYYTGTGTAAFTFSGNEADMFSVVGTTCGATLAISANCTVSVAISPTMPGYFTATLSVNDNSGGSALRAFYASQNVNLVGSSFTPAGRSSFTIGNATFPATAVGQSTTQTVTLQLNNSLALKSIAMQTGFTEYALGTISGCTVDGTTVNPSTTVCSIPVTFTPTAPGFRNAPLVVTTTEGGGTPYAFALTGTGTGPVAALTPGIISNYVGGSGAVCTGVVGEDGILAANAYVGFLNGMALDQAGNLYLSDSMNFLIWRVDPQGNIHLFAGNPFQCGGYDQYLDGNGGAALGANVEDGGPLAVDSVGGLYIGDNPANSAPSIRYINPVSKIITSVLGNLSNTGGQGNGWESNTYFYPGSIIQENLAVPNVPGPGTHNVNFLFTVTQGGTSGGTVPSFVSANVAGQTVVDGSVTWTNSGAGTTTGVGCPGQTDSFGDGCTGTNATLDGVSGIALDQAGNLYFADRYVFGPIVNGTESAVYNAVVRRMDAKTGIVTIYAGNGTYGHSGDNGLATSAKIIPGDIAFDSNGNLYIDEGLQVRMVNASTHIITTVAGSGVASPYQYQTCYGDVGDGGTALSAGFGGLGGIALDAANNLYLEDNTACDVRRVDQATQTITTIVGQSSGYNFTSGDFGGFGDFGYGSANLASLALPELVRVDGLGNVYIMEMSRGVRKIDVSKSTLEFSPWYSNGTFVQLPTGSVTGPMTVTVLNAGNTGPLTFNAPFTSPIAYGISTPDFTRDVSAPDCILLNSTGLAPGTECPYSIDFTPTVAGNPLFDTDQVSDNGALPTQTINLYGTSSGTAAQVTLLPPLLSFASMVNVTTAAQNFTLSNNTSSSLPITSILVTGSGASVFAQTNNCGATLAANSTCQIAVTFTPTILGQFIATVTVSDMVSGTPATQTAGMTGLTGTPNAILVEDQLNFGQQNVGITSAVKNLTLTSTGVVPLTISSITLTGTDTSQFAVGTTTCGTTLAPLAHCTIPVSFTPTSDSLVVNSVTTPFSAYVSVADNAPNTPQLSHLTGTGIGVAPTVLAITESIHVTDAQSDTPATILNIAETIHVTDGLVTNLPNVTLSASSLNFGPVTVNTTSATQTVTLTNNQAVALHFSSIAVAVPYAIVSTGTTCAVGTPVAAAGSCTLALTFTPTLLGATPGTLNIGDDAPNSPQTVSLSGSGTGIAPVTLSASSLNFGSVTVNTTSPTQTVTLTNNQTSSITIASLAVTTGSPYSISASSTCLNPTLAAGASCTVILTFNPVTLGAASVAALTITDNAPSSPQTVSLSGTGIAPVTLSASSLNFGPVTVNTTSATQTVTLTNNQAVALHFSSIAVAAPYAIVSTGTTCAVGTPVAAAGSCTLALTFTPTLLGATPGTLNIGDDAPNSPQTVSLSGSGTGIAPVTLSASSLNFGSVTVNTTSPTQTVTLTNNQTSSITIASLAVTTGSPYSISASSTCLNPTLAAGASCTVILTFNPVTLGAASVAALTITDNAPSSPQTVSLSGSGIALTTQTITFTDSLPTSATYSSGLTYTISATGGGSGNAVVFSVVSGPGTVSGTNGSTLTINGVGTVVVAANQAGNAYYAAATQVTQSIVVNQTTPTITFTVPNHTYGDAPFTVAATSSSSGAIAYLVVSGPATISGSTVTLTGAGSVVLQASQLAAGNYTAGTQTATVTVAKVSQTITFSAPASPVNYGVAPISLSATSTSGLAITFSVVSGSGTVSGSTLTIAGVGTLVLGAHHAGHPHKTGATQVTQSIVINQATQTISFTTPTSPVTYGVSPITLVATGGASNNAVVFAIDASSTGTGSIAGSTLTVTSVGTLVIDANQAGNANYSAATQVQRSVVVNAIAQAITFTQPTTPVTYSSGMTIPLSATGGASGNTVAFSVVSGPGTVSGTNGSTLTINGVGTVVVAANQAGNANYAAATQVTQSIVVNQATPAITWPTPAAISYGTALGATQLDASSTVAGTFAYSPAAGAVLTAGSQTLSVTFTPTNTTNYATATAKVTLAVNKASLLVTANSPVIAYGAAVPAYTAAITGFQGADTAASSVTGSASLTTVPSAPSAVGGYTITAAQGTLAATNYTFSFANGTLTIAKATSSLTGPALSAQPVQVVFNQAGSIPVTVAGQYSGTGIATPTGTISYTIGTGNAQLAAISSGTATVSIPSTQASGLYTVAVTYAGDTDYSAATALSFQVQVGQQAQTIAFNSLTPVTYGAAPITLSATATSGLPVTFTVKSGPATLNGNVLTATGAGSVVIAADQAGNTLWQAATEVTQTLTIGKAAPAAIGLASSSNPVLVQNAVTLTATVSSATGSPTGTVTFLDGSTPLGTATLAGGVATLTTSGLAVGSHTITAVYGGDGNFVSATSSALTEVIDDFDLAISVTSGSSSITSVTALPGGTAVFTLIVSPINATTFPAAVTLSVSGLPPGAIAIFSPATLPAGSGTTTVTLTIQLPQTAAALHPTHDLGRRLAPFALALLLLPFAGRLRRAGRRFGRTVSLLLLLGVTLSAAVGLSGCGSASGFFGQQQTTYTVTVTGSSGALSHSTTVTLTVE